MRRLAILLALAVLAAAPAAAHAKTFGANLGAEPNVAFDCTSKPVGSWTMPSGFDSCTWWTTGLIDDTSAGHIVPYGGGIITKARVRVGPVTGPMQIVVLRSLRHPLDLHDVACCFPVGHSEVFTPAPNGITEVPMNVRARHDTDKASGLNNYDHIAISVLGPGVPVPARYTGELRAGGGFYPAYAAGTERTTGLSSIVGFQTLINADVEPIPEDAPPPKTPTGPTDLAGTPPIATGAAPIAFGDGPARVRRGAAFVPLVCRTPQECAGLLRLQSRPAGGAAAAAKRGKRKRQPTITYGKARFEIAAGRSARVKVRLTKAGKRLLRKRKRARVYANVIAGGEREPGARLTLRRR